MEDWMIIFANVCFELFKNYEKILKLSFITVKSVQSNNQNESGV